MRLRRLLSVVYLIAVFLAAAACTSSGPQVVAGCPHCGDPVTADGPDGHGRVVARWAVPDGVARQPFERIDAVQLIDDRAAKD